MRHRKAGIKLNRTASHRNAMFRNMVTSLFKYDRIKTTDVKAKELRKWADNLIALAKRGDLHARRQAMSIIREKDVVHKLFEEAGERFGDKSSGYTRIVKIGRRPGDAAPISLIELISKEKGKKKKKSKSEKEKSVPKAAVTTDVTEKAETEKKVEIDEPVETVEQVEETKAASEETEEVVEDLPVEEQTIDAGIETEEKKEE